MQHTLRPSPVPCLGFGSHALFDINCLCAFGMRSISECLGGEGRGDLRRLLDSSFVFLV